MWSLDDGEEDADAHAQEGHAHAQEGWEKGVLTFPWTRLRRERVAEREAFLAALAAIRDVAVAQSAAVERLADMQTAWIQMMKVEGEPRTQVLSELDLLLRDEEKDRETQEQLQARGYPIDLDMKAQAEWLAAQMDFAS